MGKKNLRVALTALALVGNHLLLGRMAGDGLVSEQQSLLCQGLLFLAELGMLWLGPMAVSKVARHQDFYGSVVWGLCTLGILGTVWTLPNEIPVLTPYLALLLLGELAVGLAATSAVCASLRLLARQTREDEQTETAEQ